MFLAWREFRRGKRNKPDVQQFEFNLEDNLFQLHQGLQSKIYQHSNYTAFSISDPKPRRIHKAVVRDRVLHHAIFRVLYPIFDRSFIYDSYSCRLGKGTHNAVNRLEIFCRKLSRNYNRNIFALKCDIRRFFNSVDQIILISLIRRKIQDADALWLIEKIIKSFNKSIGKGLPLGNVTSQLFANIYLNELDQFIKHQLKIKYYLRYCDDFVILSKNEIYLKNLINQINDFLQSCLKLKLHDDKILIRKFCQGIDFLGYVVLPYYRVLRTKTKKRILKKIEKRYQEAQSDLISEKSFNQNLQSYLGILKYCKGFKIKNKILSLIIDRKS